MRIIGLGIVVVVVVAVVALSYLFRDELSRSAQVLRVGDCFEVPAGDRVDEVLHRACTEPHDGEVFVVDVYTGGDTYPSTSAFEAWTREHCLGDAFTAYVGAAYDSRNDVSVGYLYPLEDGWRRGDRAMTCYLSPANGGSVSASYRAPGS